MLVRLLLHGISGTHGQQHYDATTNRRTAAHQVIGSATAGT